MYIYIYYIFIYLYIYIHAYTTQAYLIENLCYLQGHLASWLSSGLVPWL